MLGTCATYTQTLQGDSFTLESSKGPCGITSDSSFFCGSSQTATVFTQGADGLVLYKNSEQFSANEIPPKNAREKVYAGTGTVALNLQFTASGASPSSSASESASSTSSTSSAFPTGTGLTICNKPSSSYPLSCTSGTGVDTCCYDSPGGHFLQTQVSRVLRVGRIAHAAVLGHRLDFDRPEQLVDLARIVAGQLRWIV